MNDAMRQLSDANPVTLKRAEQGLPPLPPRQESRSAAGGRRPLLFAAAATVLACLAVAVGVSDDQPRSVDVAAAAVRSLGPNGSILNYVTRTSQVGPGNARLTSTSETWLDVDGEHGRVRTFDDKGAVINDFSLNPAGKDAGLFDPVSIARARIQDGSLRPDGRRSLDGRELERLVSQDGRTTWLFDAKTLEPVRFRYIAEADRGGFTAVTDYLRFDRLPNSTSNRRALRPPVDLTPRPPRPTP